MSIKIHFQGYRTADLRNLQLANVHIYYNKKDTRKNKNKYNVILKMRFHRSIRVVLMIGWAYTWKRASGLVAVTAVHGRQIVP